MNCLTKAEQELLREYARDATRQRLEYIDYLKQHGPSTATEIGVGLRVPGEGAGVSPSLRAIRDSYGLVEEVTHHCDKGRCHKVWQLTEIGRILAQ